MEASGRTDGARDPYIASKTAQDNAAGICRFCVVASGQDPDHPALLETACWYVTRNKSPMPGTDHMLLVISKEHALFLGDIGGSTRSQLLDVVKTATEQEGIDSFVLLARLGRPEFNAMTQYHMHFQINSSDRLPARLDMVPHEHQELIYRLADELPEHPGGKMEALAEFMASIDVFRAAIGSKAMPLRYKGSNLVDEDKIF